MKTLLRYLRFYFKIYHLPILSSKRLTNYMEDFDKLWMELLFSFHSFNQTLASHPHPPFPMNVDLDCTYMSLYKLFRRYRHNGSFLLQNTCAHHIPHLLTEILKTVFDFERIWWRLFHKRVLCTNVDVYVLLHRKRLSINMLLVTNPVTVMHLAHIW